MFDGTGSEIYHAYISEVIQKKNGNNGFVEHSFVAFFSPAIVLDAADAR